MWIYKPLQMKIDLNYKVLDLFEVYNFGIKLIFIRLHMKKVINFIVHTSDP